MKVSDIKVLPIEFDFISKINTITKGTIYHAVKNKHNYSITIPEENHCYVWEESIKEFNRRLLNDEYVLV